MRAAIVILASATALGACTVPGAPAEGWREAQWAMRSYYEDHAWERNATCNAPRMRGISAVQVIEETPERLVLDVRFAWDDESYGDQGVRFGGGFGLGGRRGDCTGFGERQFVLTKRPDGGFSVAKMSGPGRA